jgi:hypothetical protein
MAQAHVREYTIGRALISAPNGIKRRSDLNDVFSLDLARAASTSEAVQVIRSYLIGGGDFIYGSSVWINRSIAIRPYFPSVMTLFAFAFDDMPFDPYTEIVSEIFRTHSRDVKSVNLIGDFNVAIDLSIYSGFDSSFWYNGRRPPPEIRLGDMGGVYMTLGSIDDADSPCHVCEVVSSRVKNFEVTSWCRDILMFPMIRRVERIDLFSVDGFVGPDVEEIMRAPQCAIVKLPLDVIMSNLAALRAAVDRTDNGTYEGFGEIQHRDEWTTLLTFLQFRITRLEVFATSFFNRIVIVRAGAERILKIDHRLFESVPFFSGDFVWSRLTSIDLGGVVGPRFLAPGTLDRTYDFRGVPALRHVRIGRKFRWVPPSMYFALPSTAKMLSLDDARFANVPPFPFVQDGPDDHPGRALLALMAGPQSLRGLAQFRALNFQPLLRIVMRLLSGDEYMRVVYGESPEDVGLGIVVRR